MNYQIVFQPEAQIDIQEVITWYNTQQTGLGLKFYQELKNLNRLLKTRPYSVPIRYDNVRCLKIANYPYLLHYSLEENTKRVVVIAVFHTSRNPVIWHSRGK